MSKGLRSGTIAVGVALAGASAVEAATLSALFSDGAVLQAGIDHPVRGSASPGAAVAVEFAGHRAEAIADGEGTWVAVLPPLEATAEGRDLVARSAEGTDVARDVVVGEVWLCSGQSNLELGLRHDPQAEAILAAADLPWLRHFRVARSTPETIAADVGGTWTRSTPETAGRFTAVGFHFARRLHAARGVPVGLVNASWGATRLAQWSPGGGQYRGMVAPLAPFPFRGVLWYQGEGDTGRAAAYREAFPAMIAAWRERFGRPDLPFLFVQLPPYHVPRDESGEAWAHLRLAQAAALALPATGMVVTIDGTDVDNGHPPDKSAIGERLARLALVRVYGDSVGNATGPLAVEAVRRAGVVEVRFAEAEGGLERAVDAAAAFELGDGSGTWTAPARAAVAGDTVRLDVPEGFRVATVRYAWGNVPRIGLGNREGLPAAPFELVVREEP